MVCFGVEVVGFCDSARVCDNRMRVKGDASKFAAAVRLFHHRSGRSVRVAGHHNARLRARVEKPEHVARRQRRDQ